MGSDHELYWPELGKLGKCSCNSNGELLLNFFHRCFAAIIKFSPCFGKIYSKFTTILDSCLRKFYLRAKADSEAIGRQDLFVFFDFKKAFDLVLIGTCSERSYRCMYHRIPQNFLSFIFYVTSIYHRLLLVFWKGFPCSFSSCGVLRLDLAYSSIFEAWHYLDKIRMYHRIPVWQ